MAREVISLAILVKLVNSYLMSTKVSRGREEVKNEDNCFVYDCSNNGL